jgi:hypothetical protein
MCMNIAIYFTTSAICLRSTSKIFSLLSTDHCYLFRLINHNNGIKVSMCIHHISSAAGGEQFHLLREKVSFRVNRKGAFKFSSLTLMQQKKF